MHEGRERSRWSVASEMMATMANLWTSKRGKRFTSTDFNPFRDEESKSLPEVPIDVLRQVFVERRPV